MFDRNRMGHIAAACFGAGCAAFVVLLLVDPTLDVAPALGVALVASAALTCVGYHARAIAHGLWHAARETIPLVVDFVRWAIGGITWSIAHRPLMFTALVSVAVGVKVFEFFVSDVFAPVGQDTGSFIISWFLSAMFGGAATIGGVGIQFAFLAAACITPEGEEQWHARLRGPVCTHDAPREREQCLNDHFHPFAVMSANDACALVWEATRVVVPAVVTGAARGIAAIVIAALYAPIALARFAWRAIVLIHSADRLIVLVDGPLGGALTYALLRVIHDAPLAELPLLQRIGYVLLGGCASVALGMANAHIVAPAILRLVLARARK